MKFLDKALGRLLTAGMLLAFLGLMFSVLLQVFARIFLPKAPNWTEETSRFLLVWMASCGAGLAMRERAFVNVDLLIDLFSVRVKAFLAACSDLLIAAFMFVFLKQAWINAIRQGRRQTSPALSIPMQYVYISLVVMAAGIIIFAVALFVSNLRKSWKGE